MATLVNRVRSVRTGALLAATLMAVTLAGCGTTSSTGDGRPSQPLVSSSTTPSTSAPTTAQVPAPGARCLRPTDHADVVRFGPDATLGGFLLGHGGRFVVLVHQSDGDACQMLPLARLLAAAGFRPLAFDVAGSESSGNASTDHHLLADDVLAAVKLCRSRRPSSMQLVGASMGGYGVLAAALVARPRVDAVVSLSAPNAWDDPQGALLDISHLATPVQLWDSALDTGFVEAARLFAREDPAAQLHIVPGSAHGVELLPKAFPAIRAFLDAHLR